MRSVPEPSASALPSGAPVKAAAHRKGRFAKDVLKLVSGTVLAQGVTVLLSPLLTRLYAPSAFGIWALFSSITSIVGVVACLRYELSIMLPEDDSEAANQLGVSLVSLLLVTALSALGVLFFGRSIVGALKAPALAPWLWMIPVAVAVNGLYQALNYWNSRRREFGRLSAARIASSVGSSVVQLGAGYSGATSGGSLIASSIAGTGLGTTILGGRIARQDGSLFRRSVRWRGIAAGFRRHRKFPLYGTLSALLNSVSWQLPAILLQRFFSTEVVGFYALGNRLLRMPMDLVGGAISQVFFQRAAAARASGGLSELVESVYKRLMSLSLAPMLLLSVIGADLFRLVFGSRWAEAGVYTQILAMWTLFWFISSPLSTLFSVLERQEFGLKLNVLILSTRLASLIGGGLIGSPRAALALFSASGVLVYGYYSLAILRAAGVSARAAWRDLVIALGLAAPLAAIVLVVKLLGAPVWAEIGLAAILLAASLVHTARRDPEIWRLVRQAAGGRGKAAA